MKKGDLVKLNTETKSIHNCPEGREDNFSACIANIYGEDMDQVMLDRDLHGCKFWNTSNLEEI